MKPTHVKPSFYSYCFEELKDIAKTYGYNLVLHGSLNRDLDLIAIPWVDVIGSVDKMIDEFAQYLGAERIVMTDKQKNCFPHGRMSYILNLRRSVPIFSNIQWEDDKQYYLDISVMPTKTG